jgi:hypothetical protein
MPVQCTCLSCGASFPVFPHEIRRGRGQYCSRSCKAEGQRGPRTDLIERFWAKVDTSGGPDACWPWTASRHSYGYGQIGLPGGGIVRAHRLAWEIANGPIPEGKGILHSCDNPPCCNARHLRPGTDLDNAADAKAHGRPRGRRRLLQRKPKAPPKIPNRSGTHNGRAKLSEAAVHDIIAHCPRRNAAYAAFGAKYGVSLTAVAFVVREQTWKHIPRTTET